MKKFTKLLALAIVFMTAIGVSAQGDVSLKFTSMQSGTLTSFTFSTGDKAHAGTVSANFSRSSSNTCYAAPSNYRIQVKDIILELVSTSASSITIEGMSTGGSSYRGIKSIAVADAKEGPYAAVTAVKEGSIYGQASCGSATVKGFSIAQGKFVKLTFNTNGDDSGTEQNVNISGFIISPVADEPVISLSSASADQSVMQSATMTDIVYTYGGTADNATFEWVGDTPAGTIAGSINTDSKTLTISGNIDPTAVPGEYTYKVTPYAGATAGTPTTGKITVTAYEAPAPIITPAAGSGAASQSVKAGDAITSIVFDLTNTSNATISGTLPNNLTGVYSNVNNTFTISGTIDATAAFRAYPYTITLTASNGYAGEAVTESGTITVKDPNAKLVAYLTTSAKTSDDAIVTLLNGKYDVTKINISSSSDGKTVTPGMTAEVLAEQLEAGGYDLVVADEVLDGANMNGIVKAAFKKSFLNFKPFFYNSGRWSWGTGDNGKENNGILVVSEPNHPIFKDITIVNDSVNLIEGITGKVLQGATGLSEFGYGIGTVPPASGAATTVCIHEVPSGTVKGDITVEGKYLLISLFNGAYTGLTEDGKAIILNACDYLMNNVVFGDGSPEGGVKFEDQEITNISPIVSETTVTITWDAVPGAAGYTLSITNEQPKSTQSALADEPVIDGTTATITGLTKGYVYTYTLAAQNAAGVTISKTDNTFEVAGPTGIGNIDADKVILSETVYTLTGVQITNVIESGIYVKKVIYEDGSVDTFKYVVK